MRKNQKVGNENRYILEVRVLFIKHLVIAVYTVQSTWMTKRFSFIGPIAYTLLLHHHMATQNKQSIQTCYSTSLYV